jgi:hypothetical protein
MPIIEIAKIQVRRGSEGAAGTGVPQLAPGEFAWAVDTQNLYIGKRMYENGIATGASDDNNVRILTQNDLTSILTLAAQNVAVTNLTTSSYRFKNYLGYGNSVVNGVAQTLATTGSVYTKLDNFVSITDFAPGGVWPPVSNDITTMLQTAIGEVGYLNTGGGVIYQTTGTDGVALSTQHVGPFTIKIPPGQWALSAPVYLPPYTTLTGEGSGKTVLTATNVTGYTGALFQTVDAFGVNFNHGQNTALGYKPRNIKLQGMTIQSTGSCVLVSLDNVENVIIDDVHFGNSAVTTSSSNVVGIALRNSSIVTDITQTTLKNIKISNCNFNGITTGILNTGTVNKLSVTQSRFSWLTNGLISYAQTGSTWGINSTVENNMFEYIGAEAMIIGTATNAVQSYVSSENNSFINVGNSFQSDNTQTNNIITVNDTGFQSHNDYFDRMLNAAGLTSHPTSTSTYQYPWVSANTILRSGTTFKETIPANSNVKLLSIPLTAGPQLATFDYTLSNSNMSRQGQLIMSIDPAGTLTSPDGFSAVTDKYQFVENAAGTSLNLTFTTSLTGSAPSFIAQGGLNAYPWGYTTATTTASSTVTSITLQNGTSTYIIPGTTVATFETYPGPFGGRYTATVVSSTISNNILTLYFNSATTVSVPQLTPVVLSNSTLQWTPAGNTFVFPVSADANISILSTSSSITYYTTSSGIQPYIYDASTSTGYQIFVTASVYISTLSSYVLYFTGTNTVNVPPGDLVDVRLVNGYYGNYVGLNCISIDSNNTTVELDLTLMN